MNLPPAQPRPEAAVLSEQEIIRRYFQREYSRPEIRLGIGDDAAVLIPPPGQDLVVTTDTLVEAVHFFKDADPFLLGHKALAVNLSDLAAMGAAPAYVLLSLTLPTIDEGWLSAFSAGFFALASRFKVELVGGNLTRGPLSITVQAMGYVPEGQHLTRSGTRHGDLIFVSGTLGDAALALAHLRGELELEPHVIASGLKHLHAPEPRIDLGIALRNLANAACDISDGLMQDLGRILTASGVGGCIDIGRIPLPDFARKDECTLLKALSGGDDYELVFTVPESRITGLNERVAGVPAISCIGVVESEPGLRSMREGKAWNFAHAGYEHFQ